MFGYFGKMRSHILGYTVYIAEELWTLNVSMSWICLENWWPRLQKDTFVELSMGRDVHGVGFVRMLGDVIGGKW